MASVAQILLKISSNSNHSSIIKEYFNIKVILGYGMMGASMLINVYALHLGLQVKALSTMESLNYLLIPIFSYFVFSESITKRKVVAIAIVLTGIFIFFQ